MATGRVASETGISVFDLMENNWSCDCNRGSVFEGYEKPQKNICAGAERFIVIDVEVEAELGFDGYTKDEILREANSDYYYKLKNFNNNKNGNGEFCE